MCEKFVKFTTLKANLTLRYYNIWYEDLLSLAYIIEHS